MVETLRKPDPRSGLSRSQAAVGIWFARAKVVISSRALEMSQAHPRAGGVPMFRISKNRQETVADVASYRQIVPPIRETGPGPTAAKCGSS
jgi:hypothetical protein